MGVAVKVAPGATGAKATQQAAGTQGGAVGGAAGAAAKPRPREDSAEAKARRPPSRGLIEAIRRDIATLPEAAEAAEVVGWIEAQLARLRADMQLVRAELAQLPHPPPPPALLAGYPTLQPLDESRCLACFAADEVALVHWVLVPRWRRLPTMSFRGTPQRAWRFGEPGNLSIVGLNVARETLSFPGYPEGVDIVEGNAFDDPDAAAPGIAAALGDQTRFGAGTRLSLLLGQRDIGFVQRTGLDALRGVQDVQVGNDISLTLGATIAGTGDERDVDDLFVRLRFYGATAPTPWLFVTNIAIQGRQLFFDPGFDRSGWRDVLADFDFLAYWQPPALPAHTFLARLSAAGGWTVDLPYQLTLGGRRGVRGFDVADLPGGRRAILTLEDRIYFGWPFPNTFDLGATFFADVGRVWPGDVPFGLDSGWRGTLGAGLRFGFPTGSRGVIRLDVAHAVGPESSANGALLRITAVDLIGLAGGLTDLQVLRSLRIGTGVDRFSPQR